MTSGGRDTLGHSCSLQEISKSVPFPTILFAAEYLMSVWESPLQEFRFVCSHYSSSSSRMKIWAGGSSGLYFFSYASLKSSTAFVTFSKSLGKIKFFILTIFRMTHL
ncbi:hypothetical protein CEXT_588161 [Caerostris extrusa]|uniref:Uncharacterized protein n=1 Tax=Caerostris extrusa TaxID=172846 RepID=A0AAV4WMJ4_CAEEX|nr:hypothetical protein CEXT_588161 [Caerostris extrusa]